MGDREESEWINGAGDTNLEGTLEDQVWEVPLGPTSIQGEMPGGGTSPQNRGTDLGVTGHRCHLKEVRRGRGQTLHSGHKDAS